MQEMLKKIIKMDEEARLIKEKAIKDKLAAEKEILESKQKIHDDFVQRARIRIEKNLEIDKQNAENKWCETKEKQEQALRQLEKQDKENHSKWVDDIVKRTIG